jgi:HEPN domain-containing protein
MAPVNRFPPDDPREWLNRARSNLRRAAVPAEGVYLEDLCYDAQQAAEKAIKAVFIARGVRFPFVHDLDALLTALEELGRPGRLREQPARRYPSPPPAPPAPGDAWAPTATSTCSW